MPGEGDPVADVVAVERSYLIEPKNRSIRPLVHGALRRVRMWVMWPLERTQRAKPTLLKHGPLSVTIRNVAISPGHRRRVSTR